MDALRWPRRAFRGAVDRVDPTADGRLFVFDYKTGSAWHAFDEDDPFDGATKLQLPVYALAALDVAVAAPGSPVEAYYWFVGRGDDAWVGYPVDAETTDAVRRGAARDRGR